MNSLASAEGYRHPSHLIGALSDDQLSSLTSTMPADR